MSEFPHKPGQPDTACEECGRTAKWQHDEPGVFIRLCDKHRCDHCAIIEEAP